MSSRPRHFRTMPRVRLLTGNPKKNIPYAENPFHWRGTGSCKQDDRGEGTNRRSDGSIFSDSVSTVPG